jgi:quercetin dioxygenase-like cupin family protein
MVNPFPPAFAALAIVATGLGPATSPTLQVHPAPHHVACSPVNGHQGQPGCWELGSIPISAPEGSPLYWHVYEFSSVAKAQQARDDHSRIIEAYGRVWLEAVTTEQWKARGGRHVATVGPLRTISSLPQTASFMEATFTPGMRSRVHTHPGPEAWVVLEGEQCLETPEGKIRVEAGESMMVRGGIPMALFGTGNGIRRALVLIVHPTGQALGTTYDAWQPTESCLQTAPKSR